MTDTEDKHRPVASYWIIFAGMPVIAAVWALISVIVAGGIISALPRHSQGEPVLISFRTCMSVTYVATLLIPYIVATFLTNVFWKRMFILGTVLAASVLMYFVFDGNDAVNKAWRRGW